MASMVQQANVSSVPIIISFITLVLVFLLTIPSIYSISKRAYLGRKSEKIKQSSEFYEDEDGVATVEARAAYSTTIPQYMALSSTLVGLIVNVITNVYSEAHHPVLSIRAEYWFAFGCWVLLLLQVIQFAMLREPIKKFNFGFLAAGTSAAFCASIIAIGSFHLQKTNDLREFNIFVLLNIIQLIAGLTLFFSCFSVPRRPSLELNGHDIDEQFTVSALGRYTFAWSHKTLKLASINKNMPLDTLPKLHLRTRSSFLKAQFGRLRKDNEHLLKTLLFIHAPALAFYAAFAIGTSIIQFAPQIVMFALLKLLEQRNDVLEFTKAAWALVLTLGLVMLVSAWAEAWTHWLFFTRLGFPIRSELSAIIFTKAMRRKDVKGVQSRNGETSEGKSEGTSCVPVESVQTSSSIGGDAVDATDENLQKSRQGTINLVGVDAKRISDFVTCLFVFPLTLTKMVGSIVFLIALIGWKSLLSGFAIFIIVSPLNVITSRKFAKAQDSLMKVRDEKLMVVTEALQGIRQIKFSSQEQQWESKIGIMRTEELKLQWRIFCLDTYLIAMWILGPVMLSAISLAVYACLHGSLSASVAFTSISLFGSLEMTLAVIPELVSDGLEAWVSLKRVHEYLEAPEKEENMVPKEEIVFQKASIAWPSDNEEDTNRFVLRDIDLHFPKQKLSVVSGATGSGKSLLLASLIGEADHISGVLARPETPVAKDRYDNLTNKGDWILGSAIAFVAQIPWIENATIKENILFGLPFDSERYKKVISCCALEKDLDILPDGEETDIGANGINLSGGQRWRVSFARALYSRAGILVLDDIFSAVDAHVGRQLFEDALTGELGQGRTRILVTHHVGLCLPKASYSVILGDGTVQYAGFPDEDRFVTLSKEISKESSQEHHHGKPDGVAEGKYREELLETQSHRSHGLKKVHVAERDTQVKFQPNKFTEEEKREIGAVKLAIYKDYLTFSGGTWFWVPIMVLFIVYQGLVLGRSWFISIWTRSYESHSTRLFQHQATPLVAMFVKTTLANESEDTDLPYYLGMYVGLSVIVCIMGTLRYFLIYRASLRASKRLFQNLTYAVLRAPLRWLDTVPVGRILNRMTADFALIDSRLGIDISFLLYQAIQLIGIVITGLFVSPWMLIFALVLLILCGKITSLFLAGAREVKRLESTAKSPIFEQFGSVLAGIGTVRAFGKADAYIERMFDLIDAHTRTSFYLFLFNRWLIWRLNIVGAVFAILVTAVIVHARIEASLAGFALSFALQYSTALIWSAKKYADVELSMNAVERVSEYAKIPIEDQSEKQPVPAAWPTEGRLEVNDLVAGYAADLPPVLKGLSFSVHKNQRVGVVGRTGAGKSSLTLALFRFLSPRSGSIHVDGIDISTIALSKLRSRLAIIPQDPVLFSGTVRSNLDPFDEHSDMELYDALERVHLISSRTNTGTASRDELSPTSTPASGSNVPTLIGSATMDSNQNVPISVTSPVSEGGLNLSQGQRQLLCLARAIVSHPKLMILDEATSAVDMATDALIQRSIREEFQDATLLVIAHRLSTIADFDRVLVMEEGKAVEYDTPARLMEDPDGVFKSMVERSGEVEHLREIIGNAR